MDFKAAALGALTALLLGGSALASTLDEGELGWDASLRREIAALHCPEAGQLALHVKDLASGREVSLHADEACYLASGVKLPVAIEVLRHVEQGLLSLEATVRLEAADLIDGSPRTRLRAPGSDIGVRELLDMMLIHSDNTATDLLIREVGLDAVNAGVKRLVPDGFCDITTLGDVRRHAYSAVHPGAFRLSNSDLVLLRAIPGDEAKVRRLRSLLGPRPEDACTSSIDVAFSSYYATRLNSATLTAFGELLESIATGEALDPDSTRLLLDVMVRAETGKERIRAGLPPDVVWAHKTGTQLARVADFGLAWPRAAPERKVVVVATASGFASLEDAEDALRGVGEALKRSGIFAAHHATITGPPSEGRRR